MIDNNKFKIFKYALPVSISLIYFIFLTIYCCYRYYTFSYDSFDLAVFNNVFWRTIHCNSFMTTLHGVNKFAIHFRPILFIILPLYFIFQSPYFLIILQCAGAGFSIIPLYLISMEVLKSNKISALICIGYALYPPLFYAAIYPFHPETIGIIFILYAFYFAIKKNFKFYYLFLFLSIICKEDVSLTLALLSIYIFLFLDRKNGVISFLISIFWFFISVKYIIPYYAKSNIWYTCMFPNFGNNVIDIIKTIILKPNITIKFLLNCYDYKLDTLFHLFAPTAFIPLFSPLTIFIIFGQLFENFMSISSAQWTIDTQYFTNIIPFVYISVIYGFKNIKNLLKKKSFIIFNIIIIIFFIISVMSWFFINPINNRLAPLTKRTEIIHEIINSIPENCSVSTNTVYLAVLSNRNKILLFPNPFIESFMIKPDKTLTDYVLLDQTIYDINAIYGINEYILKKVPNIRDFIANLNSLPLKIGKYELCYCRYGILLYKKVK